MLSIIIPAHNEAERISPTLEAYIAFFGKKKSGEGLDFEIIVINNASKDNTLDVVKEFSRKCKELRWLDFEQGGKGFAIIQGFKEARKKYVGFTDADMSTSPKDFYDLYSNIGNYDGIIGGRWLKNSKTKRTFGKYIRSKGFNYLVRSLFLFPYRDTQCGAKIFKRDKILEIVDEIKSIKWAFDVNLLYLLNKKGCKIKEFPTIWFDKEGSKISPKVPIQMAAGIIRLRLVYSPLNFIVRLYDKFPEKIKVHH